MTIIYHNPACGTSRDGAAMACQSAGEPDVILYLYTPPSRERLIGLIADMGITPSDPLRRPGTPFEELELDDPALSGAQLIDAMMAPPRSCSTVPL